MILKKIIRHPLIVAAGVLLLAFIIGRAGGYRSVNFDKTVYLSVVETGDTAQITKMKPVVAVDSFAYIDSFSYHADTTAHRTITWTSPPQRQRFTPSTVWDEARTIALKFNFINETLTVATLDPAATYTTGAKIVDTLTYIINNTTNLKDSILAVDSGTYVKLIDKKNGVRAKRWSIKITLAGGATSTLDTLTNAQRNTAKYLTTIAMICDGMVDKINTDTGLDAYILAANSGDTVFTTTSRDPGVLFWDSSLCDPDTFATVTRTQANVKSRSRSCDTIDLCQLITGEARPAALWGKIIIHPSEDTGSDGLNGIGNSDSGKLYFGTRAVVDTNTAYFITGDSAKRAALPCTLSIATIYAAANDTLWKPTAILVWAISDTLTDTTFSPSYRISVDLNILDH